MHAMDGWMDEQHEGGKIMIGLAPETVAYLARLMDVARTRCSATWR